MSKIFPEDINPRGRDPQHEERVVPHEHKYLATKRLHKGHSLFKYHKGVVSKCGDDDFSDYEIKMVTNTSVYNINKKIQLQPDTYYRGALNIENAAKIFKKMGLQIRILK